MWATCADALLLNLQEEDTAGEDAAYGTVGHSVGETWLNNIKAKVGGTRYAVRSQRTITRLIDSCEPRELIGTTVTIHNKTADFDILIDEEMVSYVREYVEWCFVLPGEHFIETRVSHEDLTPIPGQGGTADHSACLPGKLIITDLKMGKGVQVEAKWNYQGLLYAYGFFREWDWLYDFQEIEIRIAQPRRGHWDSWTCTRAELLAFAEFIREAASAAWVPGPKTRTPSKKGCQWCKVKACAAMAAWLEQTITDDGIFEDYDAMEQQGVDADGDFIEGQFTVIGPDEIATVKARIDSGEYLASLPAVNDLTTRQMEKLLPMRKPLERFFADLDAELLSRAQDGEELLDYEIKMGREGNREWANEENTLDDLVNFIGVEPSELFKKIASPAQVEEVLHKTYRLKKAVAAVLVSHLTIRKPGKPTLARKSDSRAAQDPVSEVFEDLDAIEGL